jgi:hypothetical protein
MELVLVKENEDGSATYQFDMTDDERLQLLNLGIITALKMGIEEGRKFDESSQASVGDTGSGTEDCVYGPCVKSGKSELQCVCEQVTKVPY